MSFKNNMIPYKNRSIDLSKPVFIYRNLKISDGKWYSVKQNGVVVAHTDKFILKSCEFIINKSEKNRCIKNKERNVHAFIKGLLGSTDDINLEFSYILNYNPHSELGFYTVAFDNVAEIKTAKCAYTQDNKILIQK